jgi:hypothetical protein
MRQKIAFGGSMRNRVGWLAAGAMLLGVAGFLLVPLASARVVANTIDPVATLSDFGRQIDLTGPLACDQAQAVKLRVTLTQRTTGAIAEGYASVTGREAVQTWHVHAVAKGPASFAPGQATAVALASSTGSPGHNDDAHQWLVDVTLVGE